jgi:hypothetical protein
MSSLSPLYPASVVLSAIRVENIPFVVVAGGIILVVILTIVGFLLYRRKYPLEKPVHLPIASFLKNNKIIVTTININLFACKCVVQKLKNEPTVSETDLAVSALSLSLSARILSIYLQIFIYLPLSLSLSL